MSDARIEGYARALFEVARAEGTLDELKRMVGEEDIVTLSGSFDEVRVQATLARLDGVRLLAHEPRKITLAAGGSGRASVDLLSSVFSDGMELDGVEIRHLEFIRRYENRSWAEHPVDLVRDLLFGAAAQRASHNQRCDAENDADAHEEAAQFEACQVAQTATQ